MKRRVLVLLFALLGAGALAAQSQTWQGSCAVTTFGNLPSNGFYGASNSFAQNTLVSVTNLANNKSTTLLVIDRTGETGIFMLVSQTAGNALGILPGQVAQVEVAPVKSAASPAAGLGDLPYSPDSDVFPAAGVGNPTSLQFLDKYLQQSAPPKSAQAAPSEGGALAAEAPQAGAPAAGATALTPPAPPAAAPKTEAAPAKAPLASGQVPSASPLAAGAPAAAPPAAAPAPQPSAPSPLEGGPTVSPLEPASSPPQQGLPKLALASAPTAPASGDGAPVVSPLAPASAPPAGGVALAEPTVLPPVVNPGPRLAQIQSASPPSEAAPAVTAIPEPPAQPAGGPRYSTLAEVQPQAVEGVPPVSALPLVPAPAEAQAPAAASTSGPMVSLLAAASPPKGEALAVTGLPTPSTEGLYPSVSGLAAASTPAGAGEAAAAPPPAPAQPGEAAAPPAEAAPAAPKPAAPALASAQAPAKAPSRNQVVPGSRLEPAAYYLQLGAYTDSGSALSLADSLAPAYPVSVYDFTVDKKSLYKVMIGPLNQDESGTLLYLFINQGFRDAFVRKGS